MLVHRLCFLYFNQVGGAPMPSCLMYARKLTRFLSDITASGGRNVTVHEHFDKGILGLYYL